ncbi:unnamed protein product [Thelazia callipaeda]|uniref:Peptidase A1 domain-containing protein n=1 Tax=Thelazia callipaeda TaxID=103827 RepID=A0A0N5D3X1_THECL|nr:unnamed protein product [Thelazia callipaeda]
MTRKNKWCKGFLGFDVLKFANLTYPQQGFGLVTSLSKEYIFYPLDGFFGLGWQALAFHEIIPPIQNVLGKLDQPVFTIYLRKNFKPSEENEGGLITYGGTDPEHCSSDINWLPLSSLTYWQFLQTGQHMLFFSFSVGRTSSNTWHEAISDTATSWIILPLYEYKIILHELGAVYTYGMTTVPCNITQTAPPISLIIGEKAFAIPAEDYVIDVSYNIS